MSEKYRCSGLVWRGPANVTSCVRGATQEHEGAWYCKAHHPPTVQAKADARDAKWQAEWDALNQAKEKARAAAAEQKRRADCYDALVERVKELEKTLALVADVYAAMRTTLSEKYPQDGWTKETMTLDAARAALSKSLPNTVAETP